MGFKIKFRLPDLVAYAFSNLSHLTNPQLIFDEQCKEINVDMIQIFLQFLKKSS